MESTRSDLQRFADQKTVILTSYRRDGTPVDTPVHVAVEGGRAYVRTYASAFKAKRLRRNPEVELWVAGNGTWPAALALLNPRSARRTDFGIRARARVLTGEESVQAGKALARKYPLLHGFVIPWAHRHWYRTETVNLELTPAGRLRAVAAA
ncbi:MAG: pyridoxamine 5'-phosphate oxidase family protein [Candidatus Dormibacteraeota bacterium]|nr:pyridoxamine 5'-phosphate oxidase family protein [Candidatus Dormibacteraeota bacterium]